MKLIGNSAYKFLIMEETEHCQIKDESMACVNVNTYCFTSSWISTTKKKWPGEKWICPKSNMQAFLVSASGVNQT